MASVNDYSKLCVLLDQYNDIESILQKKEVAYRECARIHGIGKESNRKYGEIMEARHAAERAFSDLQAAISIYTAKKH